LDTEKDLHSQIKQYRQKYTKWIQSHLHILSKCISIDSVQETKHLFNENLEQLDDDQQILEKEIKQFQKNLNSFDANDVSMRRENVKFYEFCLENDIRSSDVYGGWNQNDHLKYVMLTQQHKTLTFSKLYARIKQYIPDRSKDEMKKHHEWHRLNLQHISTNKRMKRETRAKHKMLVKRTKSLNLIKNSRSRLNLAEMAEKKEFISKTSNLHQQMNGIENIRKDQLLQQRILKEKESEQLRLREMEKRSKWNEHRKEQKIQLDGFYNDKITKLEIIKSEQNKQRQIDKIKKKEMSKVNIKRVAYRENKRDEKIQKRNDALMQMDEENKMKEERLSKLRLSVKRTLNQDNIAEIGGLHKDTQNILNRMNDENERNEMFVHHGYSDQKLFEDPKFELMNHLISNNLHQSKYAKQCLKNTNSAVRPRKDCNHSDLFNN